MRKNVFVLLAAITSMAISAAACGRLGSDLETLWQKAANIGGTGPGGGKIFYYSAEGFTMADTNQVCHYLEAAPEDMPTRLAWASSAFIPPSSGGTGDWVSISVTGTYIGTGRRNTALILATDANAPAAKACKNYSGGGKTDWFLPSKDELDLMYRNLKKKGLGGFGDGRYWSSSQDDDNGAWGQMFSDGFQNYYYYGGQFDGYYKDGTLSVRAVRAY
jgi:hypothetical protein